jgi:hypothetical protein
MSGSERYPFNASLSLIVMIRLSTAQDRWANWLKKPKTAVSNPFICDSSAEWSPWHVSQRPWGSAHAGAQVRYNGKIAEVRPVVNAYRSDRCQSKTVFVIRALDVRLASAPTRADVPWSKAVLEGLDLPVAWDRSPPS